GEDDELPAGFFFRAPADFLPFERFALELARGRVADLGAGTGVHALALQARGFDVTAVEILEPLVHLQRARGVRRSVVADFRTWSGERFDTVLMLMNGFGPAETLAGLDRLLRHLHDLVAPGGILVADSGEAVPVGEVDPTDAARWPPTADGYAGEAWIELEYGGRRGAPFRELYVDLETLSARARGEGWACDVAFEAEAGSYLAHLRSLDDGAPA
ncbi:MAG: class I SAM-dependent methyltransferase, partial [Gemmatimonadota bacterium]